MSLEVGTLFLGYATYLIATASPGPANLAIMATSAGQGRPAGLKLAAGVISGSMFWGACAAMGLTSVMLHFPALFVAIKLVGGLYLLWLASKSFKIATGPAQQTEPEAGKGGGNHYLQGLLIHLTNPKAILGWSSTIAVGVPVGGTSAQIAAMYFGCCLMGVTIFAGYALLFSTRGAKAAYERFGRRIHAVLVAVFGVAGLKLLSDVRG